MSLLQRFTRGAVALLALSLGLVSTEARAASVSYQATYALSPYLNGGTLALPAATLPKFDLVGQCLQSVCVRVDGGTNGLVGFENSQPTPVMVNVSYVGKLTVQRPDLSTLVDIQPATSITDSLTSYDGAVDYAGTSGRFYANVGATDSDSLCFSGAADLALFSGAGTIALPAVGQDLSSLTGANSRTIGTRVYATVTVTYVYRDCTVPAERQTWGRIKSNYR